ncbi:unnamed protein product [Phytomonas sp. Hart1]|nr:unnamed protein product [Phytomonas sp. Hart1]|eukprot:CCW68768.1 unnamed protein product [Phytomonas sp. isolate Hart1]
MIPRLLQRLSTPIIASSLSKEQLCVSLAAVAQLKPFRLFPCTASHPPSVNALDFKETDAAALVTQCIRLIPQCTFMELGMISRGASTLRWHSPSLVEQLSKQIHQGFENIHQSRGRLRLTELMRVITAAICAEQYFNVTLYTFIRDHAKYLLRSKEHPETLLHFAFLAHIYLGGHNEAVDIVLAKLQAACLSEDHRRSLLQKYESFVHTICGSWVAHRQFILGKFQTSYGNCSNDSEHVWDATRVRAHVYLFLHDKIQANGSLITNKDISFKDAVECLELLSFYKIEDPVAYLALEEVVLHVIQQMDATNMEGMRKLSEVAYADTQRFHRLLDALNSKLESSNSLEQVSNALKAYTEAVNGRRVPGIILHSLTEELDNAQPDHVAYTACVLARQSEVPHVIMIRSPSVASSLTLRGLAAFLRAAKWDRKGALLIPAEMAMRNLDLSVLNSAPLPLLLDLAGALELPLSRYVDRPQAFEAAEILLKRRLVERIVAVCSSPLQPLIDTISAAIQTLELDTDKALVQLALDRAALSKEFSNNESKAIMQLLKLENNVSNLELMDKLAMRFKAFLDQCFQSDEHSSADGHEGLLEIAAFQAEYNAPELEGLGKEFLHHVESEVNSCTPECLIAAGMLARQAQNYEMNSQIQTVLIPHVLNKRLRLSLVIHAIDLVSPVMEPTNISFTAALVGFLMDVSQSTSCDSAVDPSPIARLLISYCTQYKRLATEGHFTPFPPTLLQFIADNLLALKPEIYVDLCRFISYGRLTEGFTDEIVEVLPHQLDRLRSAQIAHCVWGIGQLRHAGQRLSHQIVMESVSDYVVDNVNLFWSGPDIARMLDGFARLHCTKRSLYNVFAGKLSMRAVRATMNRESITIALHAFGMAKYLDKPLFDRFTQVLVQNVKGLSTHDIFFSVLSHSRVMLLNDNFYDQMGQQIVARSSEFTLSDKCELIKAYGHVESENKTVAQILLRDIAHEIQSIQNVNDVVDVLNASWQMNYDFGHDENTETLASFVIENAEQLTSNSVIKLCSLFISGSWRHVPLLQAVGNHCVSLAKQQQLEAPAGRAMLDAFGFLMVHHPVARQELAQLARSVSKEVAQLSEEEAEQLKLLLSV